MNASFMENLLSAGVERSLPLFYAATGETLSELSGVLNLGQEGIMLASAMTAVAVSHTTGSAMAGLMAGMAMGGAMALLHALLTVTLRADQVVAGLSLVFVGTGIASVGGAGLVALRQGVPHFEPWAIPLLSDIPFLGNVLFNQVPLVYAAYLMIPTIHWWLGHTRAGLNLRAVGENPAAASAMGLSVTRLRYLYVVVGGVLTGLGGASLSLAITPGWSDGLSNGQGWIAIGLVIVGGWRPWGVALAAFFFGTLQRLTLDLQGSQSEFLDSPLVGLFLRMAPYLGAIVVLVLVTRFKKRLGAPEGLGKPA